MPRDVAAVSGHVGCEHEFVLQCLFLVLSHGLGAVVDHETLRQPAPAQMPLRPR